jgi:DNA-binding transcriptional MerR regulator
MDKEPTSENQITKTYFTIGEVATMLGESPSLIRFWEKEFTALKPDKTEKGTRKYTEKNIQLLQLIHYLVKQKGYTLQGAAEYIKKQSDIETTAHVIDSLSRVRNFLVQIKSNLEK